MDKKDLDEILPQKNAESAKMKTIMHLCNLIRQTSYDIHLYHGHGHLEKVYENSLKNRLLKLGLKVESQHPLQVFDEDGTIVGEYQSDLLVEEKIIVELKAVKTILSEHVAQILGYLKSSKMEHGLLINFGAYKFEIKKYAMKSSPDNIQ